LFKNKTFNLFLLIFFVIFIFSNIVIATTFIPSLTPDTINASTTSQTLNFTLNNTGTDSVVQLNITIPVAFSFIANSNTTTAVDNIFSGTANLVIWDNTTSGGFVANSTTEYFSIDVSVPSVVSGTTYNFTLSTLDDASAVVSNDVTVTVNDVTNPTYQNDDVDNTGAGTSADFSLYWIDNVGLSGYIFSTNNSGVWANNSFASMSGSTGWSNVTKILNSTVGLVIGWRIYVNDTSNNWNASQIFSFTTTETLPPTYSNVHSNVTTNTNVTLGYVINFGCLWSDNSGMSHYLNSSSINSSNFVNGTWIAFGSGNWSNFTISYPSAAGGGNYSIKIYANDTQGNENVTAVWTWYNTTPPDSGTFSPGGGYFSTTSTKSVKRAKGNVNITIPSIASGELESVFIIATEDVAFRKIVVSAKNTINNIVIIVKKVPGLPASITSDISTKVYHYIEVTKQNFTDGDLNNVTVEFTVSKSWLNQNSIEKSNILLYRWENNHWKGLPTRIISETVPDVFYSAVSSGFSYFLIGEVGGETIATSECTESWACTDWSECVDGAQTRICTDENNCGTTNNKPVENRDCLIEQMLIGAQDMGLTGLVVTAVIIVAIIVIIALVLKKGKLNLSFLKRKKKFRYKYKAKPEN